MFVVLYSETAHDVFVSSPNRAGCWATRDGEKSVKVQQLTKVEKRTLSTQSTWSAVCSLRFNMTIIRDRIQYILSTQTEQTPIIPGF